VSLKLIFLIVSRAMSIYRNAWRARGEYLVRRGWPVHRWLRRRRWAGARPPRGGARGWASPAGRPIHALPRGQRRSGRGSTRGHGCSARTAGSGRARGA